MVENKVVLVSGTSKGIGRALVERYSGQGCQVVGHSRSAFEREFPTYRHYCLDVTDESAVKHMFAQIRNPRSSKPILLAHSSCAVKLPV